MVSFAGELAPAAGLLGILFDGVILASVHLEAKTLQAVAAGSLYRKAVPFDRHLLARQHLPGDGFEQFFVEHIGAADCLRLRSRQSVSAMLLRGSLEQPGLLPGHVGRQIEQHPLCLVRTCQRERDLDRCVGILGIRNDE